MQIDDQRVREHARGMLAPGPSCVPPAPQLKREWSLWPEFGLDPGNPRELSKGYSATTFLSSSPTCPATQSGLCGAFIPFMGFASSAVRFNGRARRAERAD